MDPPRSHAHHGVSGSLTQKRGGGPADAPATCLPRPRATREDGAGGSAPPSSCAHLGSGSLAQEHRGGPLDPRMTYLHRPRAVHSDEAGGSAPLSSRVQGHGVDPRTSFLWWPQVVHGDEADRSSPLGHGGEPIDLCRSYLKRPQVAFDNGIRASARLMNKSWMHSARCTADYGAGVNKFIEFAVHNSAKDGKILCPCIICANTCWLGLETVHEHLICEGFMSGYTTWIYHGESVDSTKPTCQPTEPTEEHNYSEPRDEMDQLLLDGYDMFDRSTLGSETQEDRDDIDEDDDIVQSYMDFVIDGSKELYPGCTKFSKLQFLVRLLNIKSIRGLSIAGFEDVLTLFREALPVGNSIPLKFHKCKQYINAVGLGYDTYDACFNDCIIFKGDHINAKVCPVCNTSRWKTEKSVVSGKRISRVAKKVIRHFPLVKRVRNGGYIDFTEDRANGSQGNSSESRRRRMR